MARSIAVGHTHRWLWNGLSRDDPAAEIGVLGVPFDNAACYRKGAALAPDKIREISAQVVAVTEEGYSLDGLHICDYGNVFVDLNWQLYFAAVEAEAKRVLLHPFALFLGGDHSVTIPLVTAFSQTVTGQFGLIYFDAHADLMDECEGHRWSHACTQRRVLELPNIAPHHVAFVGLRSWMVEERDFLAGHPEIGIHTARDVYRRGIEAVAQDVVTQLQGVDAIYFTLDIDGLDPACAPGTGIPEAGGLSTRELFELLRIVFTQLPIRAMDIVEVSPPLDHADITIFATVKAIYEALGWVKQKLEE